MKTAFAEGISNFCTTPGQTVWVWASLSTPTWWNKHQGLRKNMKSKKSSLKRCGCLFYKNLSGKFSSKQTETRKFVNELIDHLEKLEKSCTVCKRINRTMDRYIDVILYLYFKENDFKELFHSRKGFCLKHFKALLEGTENILVPKRPPYLWTICFPCR